MSFGLPEIITILIILGLLIGGAVLIVMVVFRNRSQQPENRPQSAREILDKRYAKGEISREQYEQIRRDLER